jgi:hypothetical protein
MQMTRGFFLNLHSKIADYPVTASNRYWPTAVYTLLAPCGNWVRHFHGELTKSLTVPTDPVVTDPPQLSRAVLGFRNLAAKMASTRPGDRIFLSRLSGRDLKS